MCLKAYVGGFALRPGFSYAVATKDGVEVLSAPFMIA